MRNRKLILLQSNEMKQRNEAESESRRMELENKLAELQAQIRTIEKQSGNTE